MANQTVTTSVNYDAASISGLLDGESITINGGSVTIDADVRWNQQAAVFGDVTLSSILGGSFIIDGTKVWEVPFSAATGNVPTQQALGSNVVTGGTSGATGELTRVWASTSRTPATAGSAMPTSGIIKLRSRTGDFVAGETITLPGGASVTASGPGQRSWINVVGRAVTAGTGSRLTIPRLGNFSANGDWYELGTTNGADNQTFQFPVLDQCPAIWIETAAGSGVYEIWSSAYDRWTGGAVSTTDKRGMFFGFDVTTGLITLAARGTNNAGFKPPSGCKVRVPNVILSNGDSTNYANNTNPTALSGRYGFTSPANGSLAFDKMTFLWGILISQMFSVNITNSAISTPTSSGTIAGTYTFENVAFATVSTIAGAALAIGNNYNGGTFKNCRVSTRTNTNLFQFNDMANYLFENIRCDAFGVTTTNNPSSGVAMTANRLANITFSNLTVIGCRIVSASASLNISFEDVKYASRMIGTTQTTDTTSPFFFTSGSDTLTIDGFSSYEGLANVHPYSHLLSVNSGVSNILCSNIGSPSAPYDFGSVNPGAGIVSGQTSRRYTLRRVYLTNTRIGLHELTNASQNIEAYNVWATGSSVQAFPMSRATIRGGRYTPSNVGQAGVYGTHWQDAWQSTTAGQIVIACNEPISDTLDQCSATLNSMNGSGFTANGDVSMKELTDVIVWTMPYFALGVTGFANTAPTITGTNASNHTLEFKYNLNNGSGYNETWLALTAANLSPITVDPTKGVKLQVRATVNTASTSNLLTYISIATTTTAAAQQIEYPLPGSLLTVSNLVPYSRVKVTRVDTGALLGQDSAGAGTSITFDFQYTGSVLVEVRKASQEPFYQPWSTVVNISPSAVTNAVALQQLD